MILPTLPIRRRQAALETLPPSGAWQVLLALLVFTSLSFLRNAYAFSYPILYGEDGYWIGRIMVEGFWHILVHARSDYMVAGLIGLEGLALFATRALFLSDISALPQMIAVIASLIFGFVATLPLLTLRDRLHSGFCWLIGLAIVLLPVGRDGYEIFGRILNLGFYMPVIAQFALFALLYRQPSRWAMLLLHIAVLALMWSFPVVIGQYVVFIIFDSLSRRRNGEPFVLPVLAHLAMLALGILSLDPIALTASGGIPLPFKPASFLEFAVARSTIFPLLAPVYHHLTDATTLAVFAALLVSVGIYSRRFGPGTIKLLDYRIFLFLNFGVMWAATLVMRKGLTSILDNYVTSFPDRYFTGVNIMFLTAWMVFGLSNPSMLYRRFAAIGFGALILCWLGTVPVFQRSITDMEQRDFGTFRDTICDTAAGRGTLLPAPAPRMVALPIYPNAPDNPWRISVPRPIFDQTVKAQCR
ncbi:hypothetical protein [Aureimonas psammosilenae]|uniref:hypothetical protein n=1 Tax=Aureimonas psammosilenae TaxID=2495496 RepID=UPI0012608F26|nr:hypothetical protein [Aureimonas psammosilenae]